MGRSSAFFRLWSSAFASTALMVALAGCPGTKPGPEPEPGEPAVGPEEPEPQPDPQPGVDGGGEPDPQPGVDGGGEPDPQPGVDGGSEPDTQPGVDGGSEPDPQPGVDGGSEPDPQPGVDGGSEPDPQPGVDGGMQEGTTIADLLAHGNGTNLDLLVEDVYVAYARDTGFSLQAERDGPAIWVYEPGHTVAEGNRVSIRVTELSTYVGTPQVSGHILVANDMGAYDVRTHLAQDLTVAPGPSTLSELVQFTGATALSSSNGFDWDVELTSGVTVHFYNRQNLAGLCAGATFDVDSSYVGLGNNGYSVRSYNAGDVVNVNTSACAAATPATIADLLAHGDGQNLNLLVEDVYVAYARNDGFTLQGVRGGPAIYVYNVGHTMFEGNLVSLRVTELSTFHGMPQISGYVPVANDLGAYDVEANLAETLTVSPTSDHLAELVTFAGATVIAEEGFNHFTALLTSGQTLSFYSYNNEAGLCVGATFDVTGAYVSFYDGAYSVRSYYGDDIANVNPALCNNSPTVTTLDALRANGPATNLNALVEDVYVTYVHGIGFNVQAGPTGPAMFVGADMHAMFAGNLISLEVYETALVDGEMMIVAGSVVANDGGFYDVDANLSQALTTSPGTDTAAELVNATSVTVLSTEESLIRGELSNGAAIDVIHGGDLTPFCSGATFDIERGVVLYSVDQHYVLAAYDVDLANLNTSGCTATPITIADLNTVPPSAGLNYLLEEAYIAYAHFDGFTLQNNAGGPAIYVYEPNHGLTAGNRVQLRVYETITFDNMLEIVDYEVVSNDNGMFDVSTLATELTAVPDLDDRAESVTMTGATVLSGSHTYWQVELSNGTQVTLYHWDNVVGLCPGATFDVVRGFVMENNFGYFVRTYFAEDIANLDTAACSATSTDNWGFEDWTTSDPPPGFAKTSTGFTVVEETTLVSEGTSSANLTWTSTTTQDFDATHFVDVTPGQTVTCAVDVYDNDPEGRVRPGVVFRDAGNVYQNVYSADQAAWQTMTTIAVAPAGATGASCRVRMYDVGPWDGNATVYLDNMSINVQ